MILEDVGAEGGGVEVDVDLSGGDGFVAEHLLDGTEIGSTLEQMGGERVAEGVGRDSLAYSGSLGQSLDYLECTLTCEPTSTAIEKQDVLVTGLHFHAGTVLEPRCDLLDGGFRHGHYPLLVPLATHHQETLGRVYLGDLERDELAHAQSATIQHLHHGPIALALLLAVVD